MKGAGAATIITVVAFVCAITVVVFGQPGPGWIVTWTPAARAVVEAVEPVGRAARLGVSPGDVVATIDGQRPREADVSTLTSGHFDEASVMTAENAEASEETGAVHDYVGTLGLGFADAQLRTWGVTLAIVGSVLWGLSILVLRQWRPDGPIRQHAVPIASAMAVPLLVFGAWQLGPWSSRVAAMAIGGASFLVLVRSMALSAGRPARYALAATGLTAVTISIVPLVAGGLGASVVPLPASPVVLAIAAAACAMVIAFDWRRRDPDDPTAPVELAFGGLSVGAVWASFAVSGDTGFVLLPLAVWLATAAITSAFVLRPLVARTTRARLERDLFAEATEAQRALVAADIHDHALQDLTLLVNRLDVDGQIDAAAAARELAGRLRELCYELRLPVLDDLGLGPALEWLVERMRRVHEATIELQLEDGGRPPASVELAFFRVAQEALTNGFKHGQPPFGVRYMGCADRAVLSVDDHGPGIALDGSRPSGRDRRFGLLVMRQRAESIGGRLTIETAAGGGTRVELDWQKR